MYICVRNCVFGKKRGEGPGDEQGNEGWMLLIRKMSMEMTQISTIVCTISTAMNVAGYLI